jgi:hypothetical protein
VLRIAGGIVLELTAPDTSFDPKAYFGEWLQALEDFRNRVLMPARPTVYLQDGDPDFAELHSLEDALPDEIHSEGTLVISEFGKLQADVAVTVAVVDGLFKGKMTASEQVILENHAVVIGDINTPYLTIRGGAIIEGQCYFEPRRIVASVDDLPASYERPGWQALKVGFAKVWRGRPSQ